MSAANPTSQVALASIKNGFPLETERIRLILYNTKGTLPLLELGTTGSYKVSYFYISAPPAGYQ